MDGGWSEWLGWDSAQSNFKVLQIIVKANSKEYERIKLLAVRFTNGNVSEWMRSAGMNYTPKAEELK